MTPSKPQRIHIGFRQALSLLAPYIKDRLLTQIRSVWLIILYLVFFQTLILRIRIFEAAVIAVGIGLVVVGLTLFMEGLFLGLMRLGSLIGSGLPRKSPIWVVLMFALVMGFLATLAEPSIQVLQMAGMSRHHPAPGIGPGRARRHTRRHFSGRPAHSMITGCRRWLLYSCGAGFIGDYS